MVTRLTRLAPMIGLAFGLSLGLGACGSGNPVPQDAAVTDLSIDASSNPCELSGGACVPVGQCGTGQGYLSSLGGEVGCGSGVTNIVCCYASCGGTPAEFTCCSGPTVFRPVCDAASKMLECMSGTTQCSDTDM